jgi:hypothetical protein
MMTKSTPSRPNSASLDHAGSLMAKDDSRWVLVGADANEQMQSVKSSIEQKEDLEKVSELS